MQVHRIYHHLSAKILLSGILYLMIALPVKAQEINYARNIIKTLASPAFKGRGYVENGAIKAADYIAKAFKKEGLIPLNKGSYFQDYELSVNTFPGQVLVELDGEPLKAGVDYLISATSPSIKGQFKVITISRAQIIDSESLNSLINGAGNSFILLDNRVVSKESEEETDQIMSNLNRLKNDASLHFKGLMIFTNEKLTWTTLTYQSERPVVIINKNGFNPKTVKQVNIDVEAKFIPQYKTKNVAGMVKGTTVPDSMIVITAHFDHLGMMGKKVYFPGANDNASGTALMMSMARYYAKHPSKYTMVFIGFSGEEIGMLGSEAFVKNPLIDLKKIKFLTNFDMAGTGEEGIRVVNGSIYRSSFDKLVALNNQYKLVTKVDIRGESCNSDHCRFYQKGVPSFFIYTQGGIKAYHDIYDRSETLPLFAFENYFKLMTRFFDQM